MLYPILNQIFIASKNRQPDSGAKIIKLMNGSNQIKERRKQVDGRGKTLILTDGFQIAHEYNGARYQHSVSYLEMLENLDKKWGERKC